MPTRQNRLVGGFVTCLVTGVAYLATKGRDLFSEGPLPSPSHSFSPISPLISTAASTCAAAVTAVTSSPSSFSSAITSSAATTAATAVTSEAAKQAPVLASNLLSPSRTQSLHLSRGPNFFQFFFHVIIAIFEGLYAAFSSPAFASTFSRFSSAIPRTILATKVREGVLYATTNASSFASGLLSLAFICIITIAAAPCVFMLILRLLNFGPFSRNSERVERQARWSRLPRSKLRTFRVARFEEMGRLRRQNGALRGALRIRVGYMKGAVKAFRSERQAKKQCNRVQSQLEEMTAVVSVVQLKYQERERRRNSRFYAVCAELDNTLRQNELLLDGKAALAKRVAVLTKEIQEHDPEVIRSQLKQQEDDFEELNRASTRQVEALEASVQEMSEELAAMKADEHRRQSQEQENARFARKYANERKALIGKKEELKEANLELLRKMKRDRLDAIAARKEAQEYRNKLQKLADSTEELSKTQLALEQHIEREKFLDAQVQALAGENARYRGEIVAFGEKVARMEDACTRLQKADEKVADLTKQLAARRDAANDSASLLATLTSTKAELKQQGELLQGAQESVKKLSSSAEAGEAALTDSRTQLSAAQADLASVRRELATTKGQAKISFGLPAENEKVQELSKELEARKAQLTEVTAALQTQRQEADAILQAQKQELNGMADTIAAAHDKASCAEQQLEAVKGESAQALAAKEDQILAMQQEGSKIWKSLQAKEAECVEIRGHNESLSVGLAEAQQAYKNVTTDKALLEHEQGADAGLTIDELKKDLQRVYDEKHELSVQAGRLMTDGSQAKAEAESSRQAADSLSEKLRFMEQENERLSAELREQNRQSEDLNDQCKHLEDFSKLVGESNESLVEDLKNANTTIMEKDSILADLRAQLSDAQQPHGNDTAALIASKDATIASMKTDLSNVQNLLHAYMADEQARQELQNQQSQALVQADSPLPPAQPPQTMQMAFPGQPAIHWEPAQALLPENAAIDSNQPGSFDISDERLAAMLRETLGDLPDEPGVINADAAMPSTYPDPTLAEGSVEGPPIFNPITGDFSYTPSEQDLALFLDPALTAAATASSSSAVEPQDPQEESSRKRKSREDEPEHYPGT